jgi:hypothetical protein
MQFIVAFAKKLPWVSIGLFVGGFVLGLIWAYILVPTEFINATPSYLRADLQQDYLRMAIDSYNLNRNPSLAADRWQGLGAAAQQAFEAVQKDPRGLDPALIKQFGDQVAVELQKPERQQVQNTGGSSSLVRTVVLMVGLLVLLGLLGYGGLYAYRLLGKRGAGVVTPTMQAVEMSRKAEKTNFEQLGLAPPITQTMTTYVLGDDLYDESFSIDTAAGEFMGEYGVGVSETIGVGDPKKVTALELWLFDKNDIKTATKVVMSQHAFNDAGIRARLEPKGELVMIEPQAQILLETATLQLLATVVDLEYGRGPLPTNSYFERLTLELAIWPRQGGQTPA